MLTLISFSEVMYHELTWGPQVEVPCLAVRGQMVVRGQATLRGAQGARGRLAQLAEGGQVGPDAVGWGWTWETCTEKDQTQ